MDAASEISSLVFKGMPLARTAVVVVVGFVLWLIRRHLRNHHEQRIAHLQRDGKLPERLEGETEQMVFCGIIGVVVIVFCSLVLGLIETYAS
jgi:hypothetical protein